MMKLLLAIIAASALICTAAPAAATITLSEGSFGSPDGVHSFTGADQTGNTVYGTVGIDGALVAISSTDILSLNGSGEATIDANPLHNLSVLFTNTYEKVTFNVETINTPGSFTLLVNNAMASAISFGVPGGGLGALGNGANKYIVFATGGDSIKSLDFVFNPAVADTKQFRLGVLPGGVPEPSTWAMLIMGVGFVGALARRQRQYRAISLA